MTNTKPDALVELKACPFCAGGSHTEANSALKGGRVLVHDGEPGCPLAGRYMHPDDWNTRTPPTGSSGLADELEQCAVGRQRYKNLPRSNEMAYDYLVPDELCQRILTALRASPDEREAVLEEAARVADHEARRDIFGDHRGFCRATAKSIAAAIRALSLNPPNASKTTDDLWQPIETAPRNEHFLAAIHHGSCGYLVVMAQRIGSGVHDVREGSCVGWRPGHTHPAFWQPKPLFAPPTTADEGEVGK